MVRMVTGCLLRKGGIMRKKALTKNGVTGRISSKLRRLFIRRKYKDELFRRIFNNPKVLLELYNAINKTDYTDERELEIYTLEDAIYLGYKNDVSFIVCGILNLYEHQSTINPNMPLRGVIYFAKQYEAYINQHQKNIYGQHLVKLPFPQYIIFYNGAQELENDADYMEMQLSDAFERLDGSMGKPSLECIAKVYNINYGRNKELMERCRTLEEYSIFIGRITEYLTQGMTLEKAIDSAVTECINKGVLENFLRKHRAEVVGMLFEEFDMKEYVRMEKKDSYEDGRLEGLEEGRINGLQEGEEKTVQLVQLLIKNSRADEISMMADDEAYRNKLFKEFDL